MVRTRHGLFRSAHILQHLIHVLFCSVIAVLFLADAAAWQLASGFSRAVWEIRA